MASMSMSTSTTPPDLDQIRGEGGFIQLSHCLSSVSQPSVQAIRRKYVTDDGVVAVPLLQKRSDEWSEKVARGACFESSTILLSMNESFQHGVLHLGHR